MATTPFWPSRRNWCVYCNDDAAGWRLETIRKNQHQWSECRSGQAGAGGLSRREVGNFPGCRLVMGSMAFYNPIQHSIGCRGIVICVTPALNRRLEVLRNLCASE
jgi:hypothetical protein